MTPEMRRTLDAFVAYYREHRIAPSIRTLAAICGLRGPSTAHRQLTALVERGHLVRLPGKNRSLAPAGHDLRSVSTTELRAELARREAQP